MAAFVDAFTIVNCAELSMAEQEQRMHIAAVNAKLLTLFSVAIVLVAIAAGTATPLLYNWKFSGPVVAEVAFTVTSII